MEIKGKFLVGIKEFKNGVAYSTPITTGDDKEKEKVTKYLKVYFSKKALDVIEEREFEDYVIIDVENAWLTNYKSKNGVELALFINECSLSVKKQDISQPIKRTRK